MIKAVVTDIEGTTTSVSFVYEVLFPYARREITNFIQTHRNDPVIREQLVLISDETGTSLTDAQAVQQLLAWMDEDRKITPLKTLQGLIWEDGYKKGDFKGHVYDDVPVTLQRWRDQGILLYVYSSGSVQAQKLLFSYSGHGDLSSLFNGYFDTRIGNKRESNSYQLIATSIGLPPTQILFLSDIEQELEAAAKSGMKPLLLVRDGNTQTGRFPSAQRFDDINLAQF